MTAGDRALFERWLSKKAPRTVQAYRRDVDLFDRFIRKPLRDVTADDLRRFDRAIVRAGGAPGTVRRKLRAVKSLLAFGHAAGDLPKHAGLEVKIPAGRPLEHLVPSRDDVSRVLRLCNAPIDAALMQTLYVAGLRASEAAHLLKGNLRSVDGRLAIIVFGPRRRVVPIPASLYAALRNLDVAGASVFGLSARQVSRVIRKRAIAAGLPANFTSERLRSAHRAHALERGCPVSVICATLGDRLPIAAPELLNDRGDDSSAFYLL